MSDIAFDQVVELALRLSVAEQARLLERVAAHLASEVDEQPEESGERLDWTDAELSELMKPETPKTGEKIAAMIISGELDTNAWLDMINPHITDSVEWVNALRRDMARKRKLDWGSE